MMLLDKMSDSDYHNYLYITQTLAAHLVGAVEYTNCISAEG